MCDNGWIIKCVTTGLLRLSNNSVLRVRQQLVSMREKAWLGRVVISSIWSLMTRLTWHQLPTVLNGLNHSALTHSSCHNVWNLISLTIYLSLPLLSAIDCKNYKRRGCCPVPLTLYFKMLLLLMCYCIYMTMDSPQADTQHSSLWVSWNV